jgi:serine/threonine protein kinase
MVPTNSTHAAPRAAPSDKHPGAEPLPGYRLLRLLGRGGFGEVWECEAPGGLHKAIKFVGTGGDQYRQELAAFEQVRSIRHPYLLTLERVELAGQELVMVMELADCQAFDRFRACRAEGLPGIPREELLGYLEEAAEALDMMSNRFGLQHLDVKPANLFLLSGHVKVGDYGLVRRKSPAGREEGSYGFTPRYASPEVLQGGGVTRSDQYSLALVYTELLTGNFPFPGHTPQQLMVQHITATPDLTVLPACDQPVVGRALSKDPAARFPSCTAFVRALPATAEPVPERPAPAAAPAEPRVTVPPAFDSHAPTWKGGKRPEVEPPRADAALPTPPSPSSTALPPLVGGTKRQLRGSGPNVRLRREPPAPKPKPPPAPVVSIDVLHGMPPDLARRVTLKPTEFVKQVVSLPAAAAPEPQAEVLGEWEWGCRFLALHPPPLVPYKLLVVGERFGMSVDQRDPSRVLMRYESRIPATRRVPEKVRGYEVVVRCPAAGSAEYAVRASLFGEHDEQFREQAGKDVPEVLRQIRAQLENLTDRRRDPRYLADLPALVYPFYPDGEGVIRPISAGCQNISLGGVRFSSTAPVLTEQVFMEFKSVEAVESHAILCRVLRTGPGPNGEGFVTAVRFRGQQS